MTSEAAVRAANIILEEDRKERVFEPLKAIRDGLAAPFGPTYGARQRESLKRAIAAVEEAARQSAQNQIARLADWYVSEPWRLARAVYGIGPLNVPTIWPIEDKTVADVLADCAAAIDGERQRGRLEPNSGYGLAPFDQSRMSRLVAAERALVRMMIDDVPRHCGYCHQIVENADACPYDGMTCCFVDPAEDEGLDPMRGVAFPFAENH